jgi:hypothetical protein
MLNSGGKAKNYASELGKYFIRIFCDYSPYYAFVAIHNRFANESGRLGESVPLDLLCEHYIKKLKQMLKSRISGLSFPFARECSLTVDILDVINSSYKMLYLL